VGESRIAGFGPVLRQGLPPRFTCGRTTLGLGEARVRANRRRSRADRTSDRYCTRTRTHDPVKNDAVLGDGQHATSLVVHDATNPVLYTVRPQ
jgi:hypothetical protein